MFVFIFGSLLAQIARFSQNSPGTRTTIAGCGMPCREGGGRMEKGGIEEEVEKRGECLQRCAHCGPATTAGQLWNLKTCGAACLFSHCLCPCVCVCVCACM